MQLIVFFLLYPLITVVSYLPFWLLYKLSDLLYYIMYYVIRYRRRVVSTNLALVFPEKTLQERKQIEKKFYRHFADLFIEMVKVFNMSLAVIQQRFHFKNVALLNKISQQGQNIVVVGGHYANWEWVFSLASHTDVFPIATYLKINNKYFERFMLKNRGRFGGRLIETKILKDALEKYNKDHRLYILGLLADQSPQLHRSRYWRTFLGQDVPVFVGPETLAKKYNTAFVFMDIQKLKRGHYEVGFELITQSPRDFEDFKLTDIFIDKLEAQIKKRPELYLWTHNRFKHIGKKNVVAHLLKKQ